MDKLGNLTDPVVLVVDDERDVADLYSEYLREDYPVRTAYSGEDALDRLGNDVAVVLLDRHMPGQPGDDVLARIREQQLNCRVAMVTAIEPEFDVLELGFDAYLVKPVAADDLHDVVERLLVLATYDAQVQHYFQLASKHATLIAHQSEEDLEASSEFRELEGQLTTLGDELNTTLDDLDPDDLAVAFRQFDQ